MSPLVLVTTVVAHRLSIFVARSSGLLQFDLSSTGSLRQAQGERLANNLLLLLRSSCLLPVLRSFDRLTISTNG